VADEKLSQLASGSAIGDADLSYWDQAAASVKQAASAIATYIFGKVSGDATATSGGALTVTKTSGVSFAPSATTDTTNAANISGGTLSLSRGGTAADLSGTGAAHKFLAQSSAGAPVTVIQPAVGDVTGAAPLASPTFTGTITGPDGGTWTSSGLASLTAIGVAETVPASGNVNISGSYNIGGSLVLSATGLGGGVVGSSLTSTGTMTFGEISTGYVLGGVTVTLGSDASYDTYYRNSSGVLVRLANGTSGQVLTATTSAAPSWITYTPAVATPSLTAASGSTTSATAVMLGAKAAYTPTKSGVCLIFMSFNLENGTANVEAVAAGEYGTGAAPSAGAAVTGTQFTGLGVTSGGAFTSTTPTLQGALSLTPGTAYWFDLAYYSSTGGDTAYIFNLAVSIVEF
jgi:hypothetical protein